MLGTGLPIRAEGSREGSPEVSAKANSATRPANATTGMMTHESPREARGGASAALVVPPCSSTGPASLIRSSFEDLRALGAALDAARGEILQSPLLLAAIEHQPRDEPREHQRDEPVGGPDESGVRSQDP